MSSNNYRRRTQRKSMVTTIIAGVVIVAAVIAIIVVILSLVKNASSEKQTSDATEAATSQPTLYIPTEQGALTPAPLPTQQSGSAPATTAPTQSPTQPAQTPTTPAQTEAPAQPDPTEAPAPAETDAPRDDTPAEGSSYTDDSGVLHIFTPAGYNWTYYSDGVSVKITCNPHYDIDQNEFLVTGLKPGNTEFNVYYYTAADKSTFVKIPVTAYVDENLRVTRTN